MSFLLGLLVGTMVFSGSDEVKKKVEAIPLRCLGLVHDASSYKECRGDSLWTELNHDRYVIHHCMGFWGRNYDCEKAVLNKNLEWEISSLQQTEEFAKKQSGGK